MARILLVLLTGMVCALPAFAATNTVTVDVGGDSGVSIAGNAGPGAAEFVLNARRLALIKQARNLGGAVLPDGAPVPAGAELYFVLYVDNTTDVPATPVRLRDVLDETAFTYLAGSLEWTTAPSGSDDNTLWAASWQALTDTVGAPDDEGSVTDSDGSGGPETVTFGDDAALTNTPVAIPPGRLVAVRFRVRVN